MNWYKCSYYSNHEFLYNYAWHRCKWILGLVGWSEKTSLVLRVCSVRFQSVFMGMANRNRIFWFVKFSTESDWNGWKSIGFGVFRFQSIFSFPKRGLLRKKYFFSSNGDIFERQTQWKHRPCFQHKIQSNTVKTQTFNTKYKATH